MRTDHYVWLAWSLAFLFRWAVLYWRAPLNGKAFWSGVYEHLTWTYAARAGTRGGS